MTTTAEPRERILSPTYAATTIGMFALILSAAFEAMAVTTIMPGVSRALDGEALYALSFAAPLATGVVGMVLAGQLSDRHGPAIPTVAACAVFSVGLLICGLAPTMEVLVAGRLIQGLGGGALTVGLYVLVALVFPPHLRPAVFASFAAAWVLPSMFGPWIAASVAELVGWRWVFLGVIILVVAALGLLSRALRLHGTRPGARGRLGGTRLVYAVIAAGSVLAVELLGSRDGLGLALAGIAAVVLMAALHQLLPPGTLRAAGGLPSIIATRGTLSAGFFVGQAYVAYVLQENWGHTPTQAGIALTVVGVVWAAMSQVQGRLGDRVAHGTAMRAGSVAVALGLLGMIAAVVWHPPAWVLVATFAVAGAGMGFGFPRTSVSVLGRSTDADRGFNSSALTIADSLGAALALAAAGVAFTLASGTGQDPFVAVLVVGAVAAVASVVTARRTD